MVDAEELGIDPDEIDVEQRKKDLIEETRQAKRSLDEEQEAALEAIAEESGVEGFARVEFSELSMEVKAWFPGEIEEMAVEARNKDERDGLSREEIEMTITILDEMTTNETYDRRFWKEYHSKLGMAGLVSALETITTPAAEKMESQQEAVDGFRSKSERSKPGAYRRDDGHNPE